MAVLAGPPLTLRDHLQNWDDQAHLSFLQTHLGEMLQLLLTPDQLSASGQAQRDCQVSERGQVSGGGGGGCSRAFLCVQGGLNLSPLLTTFVAWTEFKTAALMGRGGGRVPWWWACPHHRSRAFTWTSGPPETSVLLS